MTDWWRISLPLSEPTRFFTSFFLLSCCRGSSVPDEKEALADQISEIRHFAWWSAWRKLAGTLAYQWRGHSPYICKGLTCLSSVGSTLHRRRVWLNIRKQLLPQTWGKSLAVLAAPVRLSSCLLQASYQRCWGSKLCQWQQNCSVCVCGGAESHSETHRPWGEKKKY